MKKMYPLLLALFLASWSTVLADRVKIGDMYYTLDSINHTANVQQNAFSNNQSFTDLVIPDTVSYDSISYRVISIGENAFNLCQYLKTVTMGNSIQSIGNRAFNDCIRLERITLSDSLKTIGAGAFLECISLPRIKIPAGITKLETTIFDLCFALDSVVLPEGLTNIGYAAFRNCGALKFIALPSTLTVIDDLAFAATNLRSVICPVAVPPTVYTNTFYYAIKPSAILYVPKASIPLYQAAKAWKQFPNIWQIEPCEEIITDDYLAVTKGELYNWHDHMFTSSGIYYDTLTTPYGCDSICVLHLTVTTLPVYTVSGLAEHGKVVGKGTYAADMTAKLTAVPDAGFAFQIWSDGVTDNPRSFTVTQDTTFRALFHTPDVEQTVSIAGSGTNDVTIRWGSISDAAYYLLTVYQDEDTIVTYTIDTNGDIVDSAYCSPNRLRAQKANSDNASATLAIHIENLIPGQVYTYTLDAVDADRRCIGAQAGQFTTDGDTAIEDVTENRDPGTHKPQKQLRNGRLYIVMPDGTTFDARGMMME